MPVVYTLHAISPPGAAPQRGALPLDAFERQLRGLLRLKVRFVRLADVAAWLKGERRLPPLSSVLTFDDGYGCVRELAFPLLDRLGLPRAVFVIAGLVGRYSNFYAEKGGPVRRHLDESELRLMTRNPLVEFGAHGLSHVNLARADPRQLAAETAGAKERLEKLLGTEVRYFAYPYGAVSPRAAEAARDAGYALAFTTVKRKITRGAEPLLLPRVNWGRRASTLRLLKHHFLP